MPRPGPPRRHLGLTEPIYLHNMLTRHKEVLRTSRPDQVTMCVCGPTACDYAHIGNARPAVVFDLLARLLRHPRANPGLFEHLRSPLP